MVLYIILMVQDGFFKINFCFICVESQPEEEVRKKSNVYHMFLHAISFLKNKRNKTLFVMKELLMITNFNLQKKALNF